MKYFTVISLLTFATFSKIYAQTGLISVTVVSDERENTVYEAYVNLYHDGKLLQTEVTDLMGRANFSEIPFGDIDLVIDKDAFNLYKQRITLSKSKTNVTAKLSKEEDALSDVYEAPLIKNDRSKPRVPSMMEHTPL